MPAATPSAAPIAAAISRRTTPGALAAGGALCLAICLLAPVVFAVPLQGRFTDCALLGAGAFCQMPPYKFEIPDRVGLYRFHICARLCRRYWQPGKRNELIRVLQLKAPFAFRYSLVK